MRYLKVLGLAAAVVAALMGFAGGAAATSVSTTTGGAAATPTVHLVNEGGHVTFANPVWTISCSSTFEGKVESHGPGATAKVALTTFSLTGCTNGWHVTTVTPGELEIHWTSGHEGTVTWTGARFDTTRQGVTCVYETNNTSIGTLTGGSPATLTIGASIPISTGESSGLCGTGNTKWEGSYVTTSALYVAPGAEPPSATTITSPTGTVATPTIKAESEGGHVTLTNPIANISCSSAFEGKVEAHGAETAAKAKLSSLSFTGCTNSWHVTAVTPGELAIEWTSGYNGTATWTGGKFDATRLGVTCVYETGSTKLGTITGGSPATIDVEASVSINTGESSGLCGTKPEELKGSYKLSSPESLFVDPA